MFVYDRDVSELNGSNGFTINASRPPFNEVGDVNGDGFDDVLVIETRPSGPYNSWRTTSYIVFGSPDIGESGNLDFTNIDSSEGIRGLDATIHPAGDWNGDGVSDLFVDFRLDNTNYIVFGNSAVVSDGVLELSELDASNSFATTISGTAISSIGDVNGDGIDDLALGDRSVNSPTGLVHIIFGGTEADTDGVLDLDELDGSNGFTIEGIDDRSQFGFSVSDAGDLNGDGIDDFIVGAPFTGRDPYYSYAPGAGYVIFGDGNLGENGSFDLAALDGSNGFRVGGFNFYTGWSVSSAGDFNGDGFDDVVAGTPGLRFLGRDPDGTSVVIFGGTDVGAGGTFNSTGIDETIGEKGFFFSRRGSAGSSVSGGGDINGDGLDDILVGAPNTYTYRPGYDGYQTGAVYILFGSSEVGGQPPESPRIAGKSIGSYLGHFVSHIGDVNGDGLGDFIVGSSTSESFVVFGNTSPELDLNGNSPGIDFTATLPEGETSVLLSPDLTLSDNRNTLVSAQISIANSDVSPEEFLSADTSGSNISASYSDGVLTLSGTDSLEKYQQVLRSVRYNTTQSTTEILDRTIEFIVDDNSMVVNFSPLATVTLNIGTRTELSGTSGADFLIGTPSKDVITGFQGADYLSGGGGRDRFIYTDLTDVGDVIVDFEVGVDVIDLSQLVETLDYANSNPSAYEVVQITDIGIGSMVSIDPDGYRGSNLATPYLLLQGVSAESLDYSRDFWV